MYNFLVSVIKDFVHDLPHGFANIPNSLFQLQRCLADNIFIDLPSDPYFTL